MHIDLGRISGPSHSRADDFEELITQLLMRERPDVHRIDGVGGDEGIDIFVGPSVDGPVDVFQCKFFLGRLGPPQKRQIKSSLQRVLTRGNILTYTLCLPRLLSVTETQWIESVGRDSRQPIKVWDRSIILSRLLKHPDLQRAFFAEALGPLERYVRSPQDPFFVRAKGATPPASFYSIALERLWRDRLLIVTGPPHLGKTTLCRKMALEAQEQYPKLEIIDIERNAFDALESSSGIIGRIIVMHDPFEEGNTSGTKWPLLSQLKTNNFVLISCRSIDFLQSALLRQFDDVTLRDYTMQIRANEYTTQEIDIIFGAYLLKASRLVSKAEYDLLSSPAFLEIYRAHLQSPHAIAYFFESALPRTTVSSFQDIVNVATQCNTVEHAVRRLFESCPLSQRVFLMLIAVLDGQYEKTHARWIYDHWIRLLSKQGVAIENASFARCMELFADIVGEMYTYQTRYRGFEDLGVSFLHPTYNTTESIR